ncbi:MAG: hypothetical protein KatS3mg103_0086 [Phycisphaerales bacterium]|nr:MAG: hypothetical protein KatS3mg103_0086 [Phycisphaerales bacterium]
MRTKMNTVLALLAICGLAIGSSAVLGQQQGSAPTDGQQVQPPTQQPVGQQDENVQAVQEAVDQKAEDLESQRRKQVVQDAVAALNEATAALRHLDEGRHEQAVAALERSVGKLELVLRRAPDLALAPVDVSTTVYDLYLDRRSIEDAIDEAERLIDRGRIQDARRLLDLLRSEIITSTTYLPMLTFPDAIAEVAPLIDQGKYDQARALLASTLNTVVVVNRTTALPILRAELLLDEAEALAERSDRTEQDNERLAQLLDSAEEQLRIADVLGYGDEGDFEPFYEELKSIRQKTRGGKSGKGLFTTLRNGLRTLGEKIAG